MSKEIPKCLVKVVEGPESEMDVVVVFCVHAHHNHRLVVFGPRETSFLAAERRAGRLEDPEIQRRLLALKLEFGGSLLDARQQRALGAICSGNGGSGSPSSRSARSEDYSSAKEEKEARAPSSSSDQASSTSSSSSSTSGESSSSPDPSGETTTDDPGASASPSFGSRLRGLRSTKTE